MNSRTSVLLAFVAVAAPLILQPGCGSTRREEPLVGSVDLADPQVKLGRQVFMSQCYQCHPGGRGGVGPALNDKPLPQPAIRTQVRAGVGAMPGFNEQRINDDELHAVARYVTALRTAGRAGKDEQD
jgi:mono/diheme cytochrome c family protein